MNTRLLSYYCSILCLGLAVAPISHALEPLPVNNGYITDEASIINANDVVILNAELAQYEKETSNQIAVVIIKSLQGEAIEDVALQIARKWGIGQKGKDNGILVLIAYDDRQARIEVGYGLEGAVPDIIAKGIIDKDLIPAFRDGQYKTGIENAIDSLKKHIGGEYTADRYKQEEGSMFDGFLPLILLLGIQWLLAVLGRTKSWWLGGVFGGVGGIVLSILYGWFLSIPFLILLGLALDFFVSQNYHRRGQTSFFAGGNWGPGGSSRSGGGFGGFGGGGFGGGGASGRW